MANRFAGFDGLRAVAALGVFLTHVALASGFSARSDAGPYLDRADIGVALFFALSGFLLYRPFVSARMDGRDRPDLPRYLRHRFLRIFPAYWLALLVLAVILDVRRLDPGTGRAIEAYMAPITNLGDAVRYFGLFQSYSNSTALGGLQQAWTLTNEIAFYLLLPVWAIGMAWLARRLAPRQAFVAELGILVAAATASLGFRWWLHSFQDNDPTTGSFDVRFHWIVANFNLFVPGMALALGFEWSRRRNEPLRSLETIRRHPMICWALAAVCFWAVSTQLNLTPLGTSTTGQAMGKELLYAAVAICLLAPVALAGDTLPRSLAWLGSRVMVTLGLLSYGIYLWHEGVIDIYRDIRNIELPDGNYNLAGSFPEMLVITLVGTIAVAGLSYVLVERPALKLKDRPLSSLLPWRTAEPAAEAAAEPVVTPAVPDAPTATADTSEAVR